MSGTEGDILVEPAYEYTEPRVVRLTRGDDTEEFKMSKRDQFGPELIYFSDCIREQRTPEPSGEEGLAGVTVLRALKQSAAEQRPVRFTPIQKQRRPSMDQEIHKPPVSKQETIDAPSPSIDQ